MAKIDFTKVEQQIAIGIHSIFVKNLLAGKATVSQSAVTYYGMNQGERPKPPDSVLEGLKELELETSLEGLTPEQIASEAKEVEKVPTEIPKTEKVPVSDDVRTPPSHLFLIDQHLRWFKKKKVKEVFKFLGTSEEELAQFREKATLTSSDQKRLSEILAKARLAKNIVLKKLGLLSDEVMVEKERKKHINKRLNIRDTWLPL